MQLPVMAHRLNHGINYSRTWYAPIFRTKSYESFGVKNGVNGMDCNTLVLTEGGA
jgi:hypothetical protein